MNNTFEKRGFGRRPSFSNTAPVRVGDELDVTIEAVGAKGDGIAKKEGFILFVPGVKQGDRVHIKVTKVLAKVGFAEVAGQAQSAAPAQESVQNLPDVEEAPAKEEQAEDSETFGDESSESSEPSESEESEEEV